MNESRSCERSVDFDLSKYDGDVATAVRSFCKIEVPEATAWLLIVRNLAKAIDLAVVVIALRDEDFVARYGFGAEAWGRERLEWPRPPAWWHYVVEQEHLMRFVENARGGGKVDIAISPLSLLPSGEIPAAERIYP